MNKQRLEYIDIARFIGIWAIVFGHTIKGASALHHFVSVFQVPIFFMLTGMTFQTNEEISRGLKKRAKRLLVPYAVFAGSSILVFYLIGSFAVSLSSDFKSMSIFPNILGALYGNGRTGYMKWNLPLWFLPCSFMISLEVSLFERVIRESKHRTLFRCLAILASIAANIMYCTFWQEIMLPLSLEITIPMFGFVELGVVAISFLRKHGEDTFIGLKYLVCSILLLAVGAFINGVNSDISVLAMIFGHSFLLYYVSAFLCCVGILLLSIQLGSKQVPPAIQNGLSYIGRRTMAILVMHKFPILAFQTMVPYVRNILNQEADSVAKTITSVLVSLTVIGLCLLVEIPVNRYFPWVLGNSKRVVGTQKMQ